MGITELLRDTGPATATINTSLSDLKGVAKEAWMLRLMDVESFRHIRAVRNLRGSRLPSGRALPREEIRALFAVCAGPRPWGWICVTLSCKTERYGCWRRETRGDWPTSLPGLGIGCKSGSKRSGARPRVHFSPVSVVSGM